MKREEEEPKIECCCALFVFVFVWAACSTIFDDDSSLSLSFHSQISGIQQSLQQQHKWNIDFIEFNELDYSFIEDVTTNNNSESRENLGLTKKKLKQKN